MKWIQSIRTNIIIFITSLLVLLLFNHAYYLLIYPHFGIWLIIVFDLLWIVLFLFLIHKWFSDVTESILMMIKQSSSDSSPSEDVGIMIGKNAFQVDIINKILSYQNEQDLKRAKLLEELKHSNTLLQRNSKITDSIIKITNQILISGEIDEILQSILDKAIEIVPNAQKGSILIYNGNNLEFRAAHGYDYEVLKNVTLGVQEIFQYSLPDFYEPCIIKNPEGFNKKHMEEGKFDVLKEYKIFELNSILSCAIKVDNEFLGVINLDCTEGQDPFNPEDMPLIKHLAIQIGIALKNARLIEKIFYLSRHDSLTGIWNRCSFEEYLMRIYQQSKVSGSIFSLVVLDINDLKKVNDAYGHEAGDLMLKAFAKGVNESLEKDDMFARYGGDEFALIFPEKDRKQSEEKMKDIREVFAETPLMYLGMKLTNISFGFGITEFPADTSEFEELIKLADNRMYKDKEEIKKPIL